MLIIISYTYRDLLNYLFLNVAVFGTPWYTPTIKKYFKTPHDKDLCQVMCMVAICKSIKQKLCPRGKTVPLACFEHSWQQGGMILQYSNTYTIIINIKWLINIYCCLTYIFCLNKNMVISEDISFLQGCWQADLWNTPTVFPHTKVFE